jgi:hypothetical protein
MGYPPEAAISYSMCFLCVNFFLALFGWLFWVTIDIKTTKKNELETIS